MKSIEELDISPTPWKVRTEPHGSFVTDSNGSQSVAFCCEESVCSGGEVTHTPRKMNARLIAAAPDLYDALRLACGSCIDCCEDCSDCINFNRSWMPTARAALAKAGGAE